MSTATRCLMAAMMVVISSTMFAQNAGRNLEPITAESLNSRDVVGRLGLPLGHVMKIDATVMSGDATRVKRNAGMYLLNVVTVDGKELPKPVLIHFEVVPGSNAPLANDSDSLYELKIGQKVRGPRSADRKELEAGYVNSRVHLSVYETGCFNGIPEKSNIGIQGPSFSFQTRLCVIEQLNAP